MRSVRGIWLPDGDNHIAEHLERGPLYKDKGTYQLAKIQACIQHCRDAGRIGLALDIGAHVGTWSRVLADTFQTIEAFEPMHHLAECFEANLEGVLNVRLHNHALGDVNDWMPFKRIFDNSGNCRVAEPGERDTVSLGCARLDDIMINLPDARVDFIKIDVEGYEAAVLAGAELTIQTSKPFVMIEQKPATDGRYGFKQFTALDILKDWGMEQVYYRSGDHLMRFP